MTRICRICGEEFEPLSRERTCQVCKSFKRRKNAEPGSEFDLCVKNAAESMHKITLVLQQANAVGMSYGQFVAMEERKKTMASKGLSKEKIEEVQSLIESGATRKEIAEKASVGLATIDRIKSGQLTAEGRTDRPAKPKATKQAEPQTYAAPETAQGQITPRELDALRALIGQAVKAFAGIECATAADSYNLGQTCGLLMAAQMILEGEP